MKTIIQTAVVAFVGGLIAGGLVIMFIPQSKTTIESIAGTTVQGSTGSTARQFNVYGVNLAAPGANATSSSILNTTGNDLYITSVKSGCENVGTSKAAYSGTGGIAALTFSVATTSTAAPIAQGANTLNGGTFTIATSSVYFTSASSTAVQSGSFTAIWAAGSYLTFFTNATNTAVCTFGVDAFSS